MEVLFHLDSNTIAKAAIKMAISSRDEEKKLSSEFLKLDIQSAAVDVGGSLSDSIPKIIERALVASKRSGLIRECHVQEGAVAGATREAIFQVTSKAYGLNVGGKIGIARSGEHLSVCLYLSIGLLHLNEVVVGLGHRSIPK